MMQGTGNQPTANTAAVPRSTWAERWQSLKAGVMGAIAGALVFGVLVQLNSVVSLQIPGLAGLLTWQDGVGVVLHGAIAKFSGFLFAVTYRYIIRQDQNPHLRSGAVGAFGLVRGLALVEMSWQHAAPVALVVLVIESFLLFGGVRIVLDWSLMRGWILPFNTTEHKT